MSVAEEREIEIVVGTVNGVTQKKPDTWTVAVMADGTTQYARNLWTKNDQLVGQLSQSYLGTRLAFTCGVSHWNNAQGQPVRSLWINEVAQAPPEQATIGQQGVPQQVLQQAQPSQFAQPQLVQQQQPVPIPQPVQAETPEEQRETRIMRQTAAKCACWMLGMLPAEDQSFPNLVRIAEGWLAYFRRGVSGVPDMPPQAAQAFAADAQQTLQQVQPAQPVQQAFAGMPDAEMQALQPVGTYAPDDIPF